MKSKNALYHGHRFPPQIVSHAVWLCYGFCLSCRDVEDLLAERGIVVSYETARQWCSKFGLSCAKALRRRRGRLGDGVVKLFAAQYFEPQLAFFRHS